MKVLIACEESQTVAKEFRKIGHEAYSCDIIKSSGGHPEFHIKNDALNIINAPVVFFTENYECKYIDKWDLLIAHPPCTYLSNAGNRHLFPDGINMVRYKKGLNAADFFIKFYNCNIEKICIENPTPNRIFGLPTCTQAIQPYQFGHPFSKRTCLWLKNLAPLKPTLIIKDYETTKIPGNWYNKGGKERQKNRSKTFIGIAKAMAEQWGNEND